MLYDQDTFELDGHTFRVSFPSDEAGDTPWNREDGHGPVSGWTSRAKRPGERVLCTDRHESRYYDFREAVKIARRDGWGAPAHDSVHPTSVKSERYYATQAVEADFERLRRWCNDQWCYVGIVVTLLDANGDETAFDASCWGFESDCTEFLEESAHDLAREIISGLYAETQWRQPSIVEV